MGDSKYLFAIFPVFGLVILSFILYFICYTIETHREHRRVHTTINKIEQNQVTISHINELKNLFCNSVTADNFFETRADDEKFDETVASCPKSIKYSGGNMESLISDMMDSKYLKEYIINNKDVSVQFLFPDPDNEELIENFVNNITKGSKKETYKAGIKTAVQKLQDFIVDNDLKDRVQFRFYKFAPSFGLKIIANTNKNNDRLYVDIYTIGRPKEDRYRFKIKENNSLSTYAVFKQQYEELWSISRDSI